MKPFELKLSLARDRAKLVFILVELFGESFHFPFVNCRQLVVLVSDDAHVFVVGSVLVREFLGEFFGVSYVVLLRFRDSLIGVFANGSDGVTHHEVLLANGFVFFIVSPLLKLEDMLQFDMVLNHLLVVLLFLMELLLNLFISAHQHLIF